MRRKKVFVVVLFPVFFIFLALAGFAVYKLVTVKPPYEQVNLAREAIASAKSAHAAMYANGKLVKAEQLFSEAISEWKLQNAKLFIFRDFSKTEELANASLKYSKEAHKNAGAEQNNSKIRLEKELQKAKAQILQFDNYLKSLPLGREIFDKYNSGKMAFLEAENNYNKGEYYKGLTKSTLAREKLTQAESAARLRLNRFFEDYAIWEKNARLAVQLSKKGQAVILVNKMESSISVLKAGKTIKEYEAEFGPNWMGDKIMKGDRTTPEGIYRVTEKKRGAKTKYHKALLLNYPNDEDKARFERLKKSGAISGNAQIGGLIEIHGGGGKGIHWTDGCVALNNKEMDAVYDFCQVSTPVIIIGADKPLAEYLKF